MKKTSMEEQESYLGDKNMKEKEFEMEYVHRFYDKKASSFSGTRWKEWPYTNKYLEKYSSCDSLLLDAGCGNGRGFIHQNVVGIDYSENLLRIAKKKPNIGLIRGNVLFLPFRPNTFDNVLSIAVIHHFCSEERRLEAMKQIYRVLKPDRTALIYVWSREASGQNKFRKIDGNDYFVTWKKEDDFLRYYYLFGMDEFIALCLKAGFIVIESGKEQQSLYCVVFKEDRS